MSRSVSRAKRPSTRVIILKLRCCCQWLLQRIAGELAEKHVKNALHGQRRGARRVWKNLCVSSTRQSARQISLQFFIFSAIPFGKKLDFYLKFRVFNCCFRFRSQTCSSCYSPLWASAFFLFLKKLQASTGAMASLARSGGFAVKVVRIEVAFVRAF